MNLALTKNPVGSQTLTICVIVGLWNMQVHLLPNVILWHSVIGDCIVAVEGLVPFSNQGHFMNDFWLIYKWILHCNDIAWVS